jgi:hypothetical protein
MQTSTKKAKPTFEEDKARAEKLMDAYADLKRELDQNKLDQETELNPIKEKWVKKNEPIVTSMVAAELELKEIGIRNKKKFVKNRLPLTSGYLLRSFKTIPQILDGFSWPKFMKKFPQYVTPDFNVKELKIAFADGDQRPKITELGLDLKQEETMQVKVNKNVGEDVDAE